MTLLCRLLKIKFLLVQERMCPVVQNMQAPLHLPKLKPRDQLSQPCPSPQAESIIGYVKNVSPCRLSAKGSEYFSFNVVAKAGTVKALCFSPKRHKRNVDQKAESGVPCKITKLNCDEKDKDVIFVNYN